jgi:hypothetical protein
VIDITAMTARGTTRVVLYIGYSTTLDPDEQFAASRNRAILVRQYLLTHFHLDARGIGIVSLKNLPPPGAHRDKWDGVCVAILK